MVTTLGMPATFVTGFFGMNTGGLPFGGDVAPAGTLYAGLTCRPRRDAAASRRPQATRKFSNCHGQSVFTASANSPPRSSSGVHGL